MPMLCKESVKPARCVGQLTAQRRQQPLLAFAVGALQTSPPAQYNTNEIRPGLLVSSVLATVNF